MMGKSLSTRLLPTRLSKLIRISWYIRHTEWLEETDHTGAMEGNAWRLQALGPGGM